MPEIRQTKVMSKVKMVKTQIAPETLNAQCLHYQSLGDYFALFWCLRAPQRSIGGFAFQFPTRGRGELMSSRCQPPRTIQERSLWLTFLHCSRRKQADVTFFHCSWTLYMFFVISFWFNFRVLDQRSTRTGAVESPFPFPVLKPNKGVFVFVFQDDIYHSFETISKDMSFMRSFVLGHSSHTVK